MIVALKYSILFVVYGIMMLNRVATCGDVDTSEPETSIPPELSAIVYFNGKTDKEIQHIIFSNPLTLITDFNSYGSAEPFRLIMYLAEIKFTDNQISETDLENHYKKLMPFGQLPVLQIEVEENKLIYMRQSLALCRYVATHANLVGDKSPWTMQLIDKVVRNIDDFLQEFKTAYYEQNETIKASLQHNLIQNRIPTFMTECEKIVEKNNTHFVQKKLTWADIYGVAIFDFMGQILKVDVYENRPFLNNLRKNVYALENIKHALTQRTNNEQHAMMVIKSYLQKLFHFS